VRIVEAVVALGAEQPGKRSGLLAASQFIASQGLAWYSSSFSPLTISQVPICSGSTTTVFRSAALVLAAAVGREFAVQAFRAGNRWEQFRLDAQQIAAIAGRAPDRRPVDAQVRQVMPRRAIRPMA
jgi:hypothetical protein